MKSNILKIALLATLIIIMWFLYHEFFKVKTINQLFTNENPFSLDKRILVDSIPLNEELTIYRFTFDSGTFGHSDDFLCLAKNRSEISIENSFFHANTVSSINKISQDTILIKLIENNYTYDSTKTNIICKFELESEGKYIQPSKRLNIPINR